MGNIWPSFIALFEDAKGVLWYVMGAYTFKSSSPFSLTRISPHPILFEGIYETPHQPLAHPKVRVIYPVGLSKVETNFTYLVVKMIQA